MTERTAVAWCNECELYFPPEEVNEPCVTCHTKLVRRRGHVCRECEELPIFFGRDEFDVHTAAHYTTQGDQN